MNNTLSRLRLEIGKQTTWSSEERDRTIHVFCDEITQAVTPTVLERIAVKDPEKLSKIFIDWLKYHKQRTPEQRADLFVSMVAKNATHVTFAFANLVEESFEEGEPEAAENVVSLFKES